MCLLPIILTCDANPGDHSNMIQPLTDLTQLHHSHPTQMRTGGMIALGIGCEQEVARFHLNVHISVLEKCLNRPTRGNC